MIKKLITLWLVSASLMVTSLFAQEGTQSECDYELSLEEFVGLLENLGTPNDLLAGYGFNGEGVCGDPIQLPEGVQYYSAEAAEVVKAYFLECATLHQSGRDHAAELKNSIKGQALSNDEALLEKLKQAEALSEQEPNTEADAWNDFWSTVDPAQRELITQYADAYVFQVGPSYLTRYTLRVDAFSAEAFRLLTHLSSKQEALDAISAENIALRQQADEAVAQADGAEQFAVLWREAFRMYTTLIATVQEKYKLGQAAEEVPQEKAEL